MRPTIMGLLDDAYLVLQAVLIQMRGKQSREGGLNHEDVLSFTRSVKALEQLAGQERIEEGRASGQGVSDEDVIAELLSSDEFVRRLKYEINKRGI